MVVGFHLGLQIFFNRYCIYNVCALHSLSQLNTTSMSPLRNFIAAMQELGVDVPEELAAEYKLKEKQAIKDAILWGGDYSKRWQDMAEQYYNETYSEL